MKVSFLHPTSPTWAELKCHSMCDLAGDPPYIWFRNGQNVGQRINYWEYIQSEGSYSCAVEGYERLRSPVVCKSIPQYTDMIPDVMDLWGYRTTCYYEWVQSPFKRASSERNDCLGSRIAAYRFFECRSFKTLHPWHGTSCVQSYTPANWEVDQMNSCRENWRTCRQCNGGGLAEPKCTDRRQL